jgi:hypothetical protein
MKAMKKDARQRDQNCRDTRLYTILHVGEHSIALGKDRRQVEQLPAI